MRAASSGLRHPASASCLGRHLRLAGRGPNNSSLFPPLAAVVVVAAEKLFIICKSGKSADFPDLLFHGWGRGGKRYLQRRFLRKRGAAGNTAWRKRAEPSQALPRQLPRRGSQGLKFVAKVLGLIGKLPGVPAPPRGSCRAATEGLWMEKRKKR